MTILLGRLDPAEHTDFGRCGATDQPEVVARSSRTLMTYWRCWGSASRGSTWTMCSSSTTTVVRVAGTGQNTTPRSVSSVYVNVDTLYVSDASAANARWRDEGAVATRRYGLVNHIARDPGLWTRRAGPSHHLALW